MNESHRTTYTNIKTKLKNCKLIKSDMIVKKDVVKTVMHKNGVEEPIYDYKLNIDYWKEIKEPINVVLDEAHSIGLNARRSFSKLNEIMTSWLSMIRRVLGETSTGYGQLVLITQLHNRIDCIAREMATNVRWHRCIYSKTCKLCGCSWMESSDEPEPIWNCQNCGSYNIKKHNHVIEVWHFASMDSFLAWKEFGIQSFHSHYLIEDIEKYFPMYNTLQWDNLFDDL